jgi:hypothetical protein
MSSSADAGGVNCSAKPPMSSMYFTIGIPLSVVPSTTESIDMLFGSISVASLVLIVVK